MFKLPIFWCSLANILKFQRLEFGGQKLTKGPNVLRQACCHRWRTLLPSGTNRALPCALSQRQLPPQAHMRSSHIVEGLEEDHALPQALTVFAEAVRFAPQRRQGLTQGQVYPFDQGRADRETQLRQAFGAKHDAGTQCQQCAVLLLFDQLPIDQIWMGLTDGLAWAAPLASSCKRRHDMEGGDERRQIARESVAEERRDPRDTRLGGRHDLLSRFEGTWPHDRHDHQPKLGSKADPDPLPPILAVGQAFTCLVRLTSVLALDKVP